jgi:hypothetical protein
VTYVVPGIHPTYEIACGPGEGNHTKHASSDYAFHRTLKFADGLAQVGWDILVDNEFAKQVTKEFKDWRRTVAL